MTASLEAGDADSAGVVRLKRAECVRQQGARERHKCLAAPTLTRAVTHLARATPVRNGACRPHGRAGRAGKAPASPGVDERLEVGRPWQSRVSLHTRAGKARAARCSEALRHRRCSGATAVSPEPEPPSPTEASNTASVVLRPSRALASHASTTLPLKSVSPTLVPWQPQGSC